MAKPQAVDAGYDGKCPSDRSASRQLPVYSLLLFQIQIYIKGVNAHSEEHKEMAQLKKLPKLNYQVGLVYF